MPEKEVKITDESLVEMIRGSEAERERALHYIYVSSGWKELALRLLLANKANTPDAEDAVQEAMIVLDNHVRNFKYEPTASLKNFFIGICRGRWYSNKRSVKRINWTDDHRQMDKVEVIQPEIIMLEEEKKQIVRSLLQQLDERCREILSLYKLSYSMAEISERLKLKNTNNARQRVFKCREKLSKMVVGHPLIGDYQNKK